MKIWKKFKSLGGAALRRRPDFILGLAVGIATLFAAAPVVEAQVTATTSILLTNFPTSMNGAAGAAVVTNIFGAGNTNTPPTANIFAIRQGVGMGSVIKAITGSGATVGLSITWAGTIDGTNWFSLGNLQTTNILAASATNVIGTNFAAALLNNIYEITPWQVEWAALPGTNITGIQAWVSFGNVIPLGP